MDPSQSPASLQNTSPATDPAAVLQISTELTSQASRLDLHHHQLSHLTSLTEKLVQGLQELRTAITNPPVAPASSSPENPPPAATSSVNPRLAFPEKFDGNPTKCKGFLLQCTLFVEQQPSLYTTNASRIAFVCSLLTGRALEWATAVWRTDGSSFASFSEFLQQFRHVFEHSTERGDAGEQLLSLTQGNKTAAEYALTFRTLAAQTDWVESTLKTLFRKGLTMELQSELACRDEGRTLTEYIDLAIQVDNLIRSRRSVRPLQLYHHETPTQHEPMQIGVTHITPEERERRIQHRLCLYCGQSGHMKFACPTRPSASSRAVSPRIKISMNPSSFQLPVIITIRGKIFRTIALIDSGAAGNFMSRTFAEQCRLNLTPCLSSLAVEALDGRPLGEGRIQDTTEEIKLHVGTLHTEIISFYVIQSPHHPIILGHPWLHAHNPHISWKEGQIIHWDASCQNRCLTPVTRISLQETKSEPSNPSSPTHRLPRVNHVPLQN